MILFDDGSSAFAIAWGVVDDPALRVVSPDVAAVGQVGHELANLPPRPDRMPSRPFKT